MGKHNEDRNAESTGLLTCDASGVVIACTSEVVEQLGIGQQDLIGTRFRDLPLRPVDEQGQEQDRSSHPVEQAILRQSHTTGLLRHERSGAVIRIQVSPWLGEQTGGVVCRLEALPGQQETELQRYAYKVAHNLKSPLIAVMGHLEFAEEAALQGNLIEMRRELARIDAAAEKMSEMLEELTSEPSGSAPRVRS